MIERAIIFAEDDTIRASDIGFLGSEAIALSKEGQSLQEAVKVYEKQEICRVLNSHNWNKVEAARSLGIGLSSLYRKIDELGIHVVEHKSN